MKPIFLSLPDRVAIAVPPLLRCMTTYVLLEQEDWFEDDIRFLRQIAHNGMNFIDIGANFGVYALSLAGLIGAQGRGWAIEPARDTARYLQQSLDHNGFSHVTLLQAAVSDHVGSGFLAHGFSPESAQLSAQLQADTSQDGEQVSLITIDSLMQAEGWPRIDLVKIDADEHEPEVIAGATEFLARQDAAIMFEIMGNHDVSLTAANMLVDRGYRLFRLVPGLMILVPFDPDAGAIPDLLNLYALKPSCVTRWAEAGWLATDMQPGQVAAGADPVIAHWRKAHDRTLPAAQRWGHLAEATLYHQDRAAHHDLAWLVSAVRLASDWGQRQLAFHQAEQALTMWQAGAHLAPFAEFIPPCDDPVRPGFDVDMDCRLNVAVMMDRMESYTTLLRPEKSWQTNRDLLTVTDQPLSAVRRYLLTDTLLNQEMPRPWTDDSRLVDAQISPHAAIWAGQTEIIL